VLRYGLGKHFWNVPMAPDLYPAFQIVSILIIDTHRTTG
jgi:hypothetical protein